MALKIVSSGLAEKRVLTIDPAGVRFHSGVIFSGGTKQFQFNEIECVLLNETEDMLSFQVGSKVFTICVNPKKPKHQEVIDTLVKEVKKTFA